MQTKKHVFSFMILLFLLSSIFAVMTWALTYEEELENLEQARLDAYSIATQAADDMAAKGDARNAAEGEFNTAKTDATNADANVASIQAEFDALDTADPNYEENKQAVEARLSTATEQQTAANATLQTKQSAFDTAKEAYALAQGAHAEAQDAAEQADEAYWTLYNNPPSSSSSQSEESSEASVSSEAPVSSEEPVFSEEPETTEESEHSIVMVYPSEVSSASQSESSASSEMESSSELAAGTTDTNTNRTGKTFILFGIILILLSVTGLGFFVYSLFIQPRLKNKGAGKKGKSRDFGETQDLRSLGSFSNQKTLPNIEETAAFDPIFSKTPQAALESDNDAFVDISSYSTQSQARAEGFPDSFQTNSIPLPEQTYHYTPRNASHADMGRAPGRLIPTSNLADQPPISGKKGPPPSGRGNFSNQDGSSY